MCLACANQGDGHLRRQGGMVMSCGVFLFIHALVGVHRLFVDA